MGQDAGLGRIIGGLMVVWIAVGCAPAVGDPSSEDEPPGTDDGTGLGEIGPPSPGEFPPVQERVPLIDLQIAPGDWAALEADPYTEQMFPVQVTMDGWKAQGRMRFRGASTRTLPQKSFRLKLDAGNTLDGRDSFNLLASYSDAGKLSEKFAVDLFIALGLPVPRARYVRVSVNGVHQGLYLDMEQVEGKFVRARDMEKATSRYRCGGRNCEMTLSPGPYQGDFEKKNNLEAGRGELDELLRFINRTGDDTFEAQLPERIDLDAYLGNLAADTLISNNLMEDARSYWLHEPASDRWTHVPWDLNNALLTWYRDWDPQWPPIVERTSHIFNAYDTDSEDIYLWRAAHDPLYRPTWSVLATRISDRPALRSRLIERIERALEETFTEEKTFPHIDALYARIESELEADPHVDFERARGAPAFLKEYVRGRRAELQWQLAALRAHGSGPLVINHLDVSTGRIELYNRGAVELSIGGLVLTDDLREPWRHALPEGLRVPAGGKLELLADGAPERGPAHLPFVLQREGGELGLFDGVRFNAPLDAIYFGPREQTPSYGRVPDGAESFE